MQGIMCANEMLDPTTLIPLAVPGHVTTMRTMSLVELGKKLLVSAKDGDIGQVRSLMGKGAPFTTDWLGTSALHLAAQHGHLQTAEALLRAGISRDARTKVDRTPLHVASQEGNTAIVKLLLAHGADVDSKDMLKMTPLHWAVEREHPDTVRVLLESGANPRLANKFEKTPFTIAVDNGRHDLFQLMQTTEVITQPSRPTEEMEEATLTATQSLAVEMGGGVPPATHQEEVQTTSGGVRGAQQGRGRPANTSKTAEHSSPTVKKEFIIRGPPLKNSARTNKLLASPSELGQGTNTLQLLQAHGITMLPADDSTLVASAVESGQTVVLTEAGKLALNLTRTGQVKSPGHLQMQRRAITAIPVPGAKRKMITIRSGQIVSVGSVAPNILKRERDPPDSNHKPAKMVLTRAENVNCSSEEYTKITRQLEEATRQMEQYKLLFTKKEQEAAEYKHLLESLTVNKHV